MTENYMRMSIILLLSARRVIAANEICRFLDIFGKNIVSFEDTFSILEGI
jgi:hypothetical protein